MNERIWDFVRQAEAHAKSNVHLIGWNYTQEYNNKFVELIVRECMAVADKTQLVDRQLAVSFALKEHFGVK